MSERRDHSMAFSRRSLLKGVGATSALSLAGCMSPHGHRASYTSQIIKPGNHNTAFHWVDMALQCVRNQRVLTPRAAYDYGLTTAAGFLAANGVTGTYHEPYGIGPGPVGADPEVAYGVAFSIAAAEAFQQPFPVDLRMFLDRVPASNPSPWTCGCSWTAFQRARARV